MVLTQPSVEYNHSSNAGKTPNAKMMCDSRWDSGSCTKIFTRLSTLVPILDPSESLPTQPQLHRKDEVNEVNEVNVSKGITTI